MKNEIDPLDTPLFGDKHTKGFAYHNVGALFRAGDPAIRFRLDSHYGKRGGHIPDMQTSGLLVAEADQAIIDQADYLSKTYGKTLEVKTLTDLPSLRGSLVVPYINLPEEVTRFNNAGIDTWGLHPELVHITKNKATAHQLFSKYSQNGFEVPDHIVGDVRELPGFGHHFYHDILKRYADLGIFDFKPGLIVRAAESDGGYGSCRLEVHKDQQQPFQVFNDGVPEPTNAYTTLSDALNHTKEYLLQSANSKTDVEPRIVVSRLMDLADSPGLSVVINNGHVTSLGWNGQVQAEGGNACIGTSSYVPKNEYTAEFQQQYEQQTADNFIKLLKQTAKSHNINFDQVSGFANVDLMIPGPKELEYRRRLGLTPETVYLAEINPRITNFTDALLALEWAKKNVGRITTRGIVQSVAAGILTIDKHPVPKDSTIAEYRRKIIDLDQKLEPNGTRVLLRMPDQPNAGLILSGNIDTAQKELALLKN